jgi:hypothetical protein
VAGIVFEIERAGDVDRAGRAILVRYEQTFDLAVYILLFEVKIRGNRFRHDRIGHQIALWC